MQRFVLLLVDGSHEIVEYDTSTSSSVMERQAKGGTILGDYPTRAEAEAEQARDAERKSGTA
jgi:hypothetical protein